MSAIPVLLGALLVAGAVYDTVRLLTPAEPRWPPPTRLRGRRAGLEAAECWLTGLRLHGRIDAATYRRRMAALARGRRTSPTGRQAYLSVVHGYTTAFQWGAGILTAGAALCAALLRPGHLRCKDAPRAASAPARPSETGPVSETEAGPASPAAGS
ncbi:hypothetical protein [Streptomyces sp. WAC00263]|uniref:hypothetical protein n=1 Tax=Streptomyces sp. WAC00263 TaxID=1917422 RepID=UPI0015EFD237|nr:hypothetical protein [Streptomyces sp. WAC00263]